MLVTCAPPCPIQCQSKRFDLAHGPFSSRERKIFCKMTLNGAWGLKINIILVVLWVKRTMYPHILSYGLFAAREKNGFVENWSFCLEMLSKVQSFSWTFPKFYIIFVVKLENYRERWNNLRKKLWFLKRAGRKTPTHDAAREKRFFVWGGGRPWEDVDGFF